MEVNSNMALAAIEAGEHSFCSSICNFRSLLDRRVPHHSKQGLLPYVTCPRFFRVCVHLCNWHIQRRILCLHRGRLGRFKTWQGMAWRRGQKELSIQTQPIYVHTHNSSLSVKKCRALPTASPFLNPLAVT